MLTITASLAARASASTCAEPWIERAGIERAERDDLGGHPQRGLASQVRDAPPLLGRAALGARPRRRGRWKYRRATKYRKFSHEPSALALAERGQLLAQDVVVVAVVSTNSISSGSRSRAMPVTMFDEAVGVRADEVQRALGEPVARELGADRRPPAPGQARVAGVACRRASARAATAAAPRSAASARRTPRPTPSRRRPQSSALPPELARALLGRDVG